MILHASKILHDSTIAKIIKAPINLFYDVTPIGKITQRVNDDMSVFDEEIYHSCKERVRTMTIALCKLLIALLATYQVIPIVLLIVFVALKQLDYVTQGLQQSLKLSENSWKPRTLFCKKF